MNGTGGLEGWRWLFILEGIPSCLLSLLVLALFPDYPETVRWLNAEERELATRRLQGLASVGHSKISWEEAKKTLKEWRLYVHYIMYVFHLVYCSHPAQTKMFQLHMYFGPVFQYFVVHTDYRFGPGIYWS